MNLDIRNDQMQKPPYPQPAGHTVMMRPHLQIANQIPSAHEAGQLPIKALHTTIVMQYISIFTYIWLSPSTKLTRPDTWPRLRAVYAPYHHHHHHELSSLQSRLSLTPKTERRRERKKERVDIRCGSAERTGQKGRRAYPHNWVDRQEDRHHSLKTRNRLSSLYTTTPPSIFTTTLHSLNTRNTLRTTHPRVSSPQYIEAHSPQYLEVYLHVYRVPSPLWKGARETDKENKRAYSPSNLQIKSISESTATA